jgi:hypothetical protein
MIAGGLFISNPSVSMIGGGLCAIRFIFPVMHENWSYTAGNFIWFAYWVLVALIFINWKKKNKKIFAYIACGILLLVILYYPMDNIMFWVNLRGHLPSFHYIASDLIMMVKSYGLLIIGTFLLGLSFETAPKKVAQPATQSVDTNTESTIVRLEKLQNLLDNNVITKEEFEEKKKQILGL